MNPNGRYDSRYDHPISYEQYPNFYQDQMIASGDGGRGGRRIASSTRGGGGMSSYPEVSLHYTANIYNQFTVIDFATCAPVIWQ